jgi:hypothetical protein
MVSTGGLHEVWHVFQQLEKHGPLNFEKGILQSIGYKEFHSFYQSIHDKASVDQILTDPSHT